MKRKLIWAAAVILAALFLTIYERDLREEPAGTEIGAQAETEAEHAAEAGTVAQAENEAEHAVEAGTGTDGIMEVHFLDVGQGDCTLIKNGGHAMLIDAGDNSKGTRIQFYLQKQGVEHLDYLILTHTDADHIGGADVILTKFEVDTVFMGDFPRENATYRDVLQALSDKGLSYSIPKAGDSYELGDASFTIAAPTDTYDNPNDNSIGLIIKKGDNRFLFTGDAEESAEKDMVKTAQTSGISLEADVYQAGHHGSATSSTEELLDAADPDFTVISCGADNPYGNPQEETIQKLKERGIQILRTDELGTIVAQCDGKEIVWCYPDQEKKEDDTKITYVCNTRSLKFHRPDCDSVKDIAEKNKMEVTEDRETLISMGYVPCKACKP